jgi:hypothetical protein
MKSLLTKTLIFSIILGIITAVLKYSDILPVIHNQWHFILVFYYVLTGYIFYVLLKSFQKAPRKFLVYFLSISLLRMFLFIAIILLYVFVIQSNNIQDAISFILTFTAYYILFTTWEVVQIVSILKHKKQP